MKKNTIDISIQLLKNKKIVAFPTETVYGLGADANSFEAIKKIFKIKNRPITNPLIVHIDSYFKLKYWSNDIPNIAYKIATYFWPGPLTILLKKKSLLDILLLQNQTTSL